MRSWTLTLSLITIAFGVLLTLLGGHAVSNDARLISSGIAAKGRIEKLYQVTEVSDSGSVRKEYWVAYTFADQAGRTIRRETRIRNLDWLKLKVGRPIDVRYVPDEPSINAPLRNLDTNFGWWSGIVGSLIIVLGCSVVCWKAWTAHQIRRVASTGFLVFGRVTGFTLKRTKHFGSSYRLTAAFLDDNGRSGSALSLFKRPTSDFDLLREFPIPIIYDPDDLSKAYWADEISEPE